MNRFDLYSFDIFGQSTVDCLGQTIDRDPGHCVEMGYLSVRVYSRIGAASADEPDGLAQHPLERVLTQRPATVRKGSCSGSAGTCFCQP